MITVSRLSLFVVTLSLLACKADISVQDEPVDPVAQEIALAFVERPLLLSTEDGDTEAFAVSLQDPTAFNPGARLILKQNAFAQSAETDLTATLFAEGELYDVKDLTASPDGLTLLFALRSPELADTPDELQPKWDLWRYDVLTKSLSPLISDVQQAQRGHDISPAFLADGRIIFSSTRQTTSRQILLDEFKPQYTALDEDLDVAAFNLHVMNADGSNIEQLTFNLSHDLYPVLLDDGYVLYSRWDNHGNRSMFNWYRMRPDGTENQLIYGWHSHTSGAEQSRVEFNKAILLNPNRTETYLYRYIAYRETENYQFAFSDINTYVNAIPNDTMARTQRMQLSLLLSEYETLNTDVVWLYEKMGDALFADYSAMYNDHFEKHKHYNEYSKILIPLNENTPILK